MTELETVAATLGRGMTPEPHVEVELVVEPGVSDAEMEDVRAEVSGAAQQLCEAPIQPEVTWIVRPLPPVEVPALAVEELEAPKPASWRPLLTHAVSGVLGGAVVALVVLATARAASTPAPPVVVPAPAPSIAVAAELPRPLALTPRPFVHPSVVPPAAQALPQAVALAEPARVTPPPHAAEEDSSTPAVEPRVVTTASAEADAPADGTAEPAIAAEPEISDEAPAAEPVQGAEADEATAEAPQEAQALPEHLSPAQVLETIAANQAQVTDCVSAQKARRPSSSGRLMMTWSILPSGEAADVGAEDPTLAPELTECLQAAILDWSFPEHAGEAQPVRLPFAF